MKRENTIYLVTGAAGHLGSTLCAKLHERGERVRALVLEGEDTSFLARTGAEIFVGNVLDPRSMEEFFSVPKDFGAVVLHCAGIVDIGGAQNPAVEAVNVEGTRNVMQMSRAANARKIVYVCSVHALCDLPKGRVKREVEEFCPDKVDGAYAKSKAEAANMVLGMAREGLPAVAVFPSGIIGPYCGRGNHLVQLVKNYLNGKLPACVRGGYDFVDVRDVADGILAAADRGRVGESYILSGGYYEIPEMLALLREAAGGRKISVVPTWMAKMAAPLSEYIAKKRKRKPLFTAYSLRVLHENGRYSHDKATAELGYRPRELYETLKDTAQWLTETGEVKPKKQKCAERRRVLRARAKAHG